MTNLSEPVAPSRWELSELSCQLLSRPARRVVRQWLSDPCFRDQQCEPALLPLASNGRPGFIGLAHAADNGVPSSAILDELKSVGLVQQGPDGELLLSRSAYLPGRPRPCGGWKPVGGAQRGKGNQPPMGRRFDDPPEWSIAGVGS
ncbi:hypothetical protein CF392_09190 [Tamilnaduibacter salinus]|uniref:Uncharacterized protein n=1 Tax=Tamilnaduibacter salinus TaxID=1484056 RepID=A0A2A2I3V8_9GAMM|nr:DUF6502 family protein [Tamilnaduibacter salinus]PAV25815.1 hypothetical protein CF392_09190 [Tamilnaduibacter salinus]